VQLFIPVTTLRTSMASPFQKRTLILMRGLPGSGKSTAAVKLAEGTSSNRHRLLAADDFFVQLGIFAFDATKAGEAYAVRHDAPHGRVLSLSALGLVRSGIDDVHEQPLSRAWTL